MSNGSWYETGFSGADREAEKRELGGGPSRFWLRAGESREVVFIDDSPFCTREHQFKLQDSRFPEFVTCVANIHDACPSCDNPSIQKAEYTGHLTAIDCTGYTSKKDGKEHKYEMVEFCPKTKVLGKLKMKKQNRGTLLGSIWNIARGDDHSPNTGDDIDFVREIKDEAALYDVVTYKGKRIKDLIAAANGNGPEAAKARKYLVYHFQVPAEGPIPEKIPVFNYPSLHAPLEPGDMKKAIAGAISYTSKFGAGNASGGAGVKADDEIPF